jgi:hypothetical protein
MISDLASFRVVLADYLNRDNLSADTLNTFIDVGRRAAARAKAREQEARILLTLTADLRSALPPRFMAARMLYTVAGIGIPQVSGVFASVGAEGGYRIIGGDIEVTGGGLKAGDQVELHYYEFPSALTQDADKNSFLEANADLWLWQAVAEGARYLQNEALANAAAQAVEQIGRGIETTAKEGRQHGGPRQMRVRI